MSWDPILGSQGQRDSVIPPLQCPLGIPNWSGQHQERRLGTVPSVTQTGEAPTPSVLDSLRFSLFGGNINNDCLLLMVQMTTLNGDDEETSHLN